MSDIIAPARWDGVPADPMVSGWHQVLTAAPQRAFWCAQSQRWLFSGLTFEPLNFALFAKYVGAEACDA